VIRPLLALGLATAAWAATADDLLTQVNEALTPADRRDPTTGVRAQAIEAVRSTPGLAAVDRARLDVALAEAWVEAKAWERAQVTAQAVTAEATTPPDLKERAALAWLAGWSGAETAGDPLVAVAALGVESPRVVARALTLRAQGHLATGDAQALTDYDGALKALAALDPADRVPLLALRVTAMEHLGADAAAVQTWLNQRMEDPAVVLFTGGAAGGLLGQMAPALIAPRRDGTPGTIDLSTWRGAPALVVFGATWSEACATLPARLPPGVPKTLWVLLDGPETMAGIPAWRSRHGVTAAMVGEGRGWDGELDDAWRIEQIPTLVLLDAQGRITALGPPEAILPRLGVGKAVAPETDVVLP
jgi:hypothetical protein